MAVLNCACKKVVTCYPNGFNFPLLWLAAWQMWFTKKKMVQRGKKSIGNRPPFGKAHLLSDVRVPLPKPKKRCDRNCIVIII